MPSTKQRIVNDRLEQIGPINTKTGQDTQAHHKNTNRHDTSTQGDTINTQIIHRDSSLNNSSIPILRKYYKKGTRQLHSEDGPAVIFHDGTKHWYKDGVRHRKDGAAVLNPNGTYEYWVNGNLHREGNPAILDNEGTQTWYRKGKIHREDGPAITQSDGTEYYYLNGLQVKPFKFSESLASEFDPIMKAIEKFKDRVTKNNRDMALSTLNALVEDIQRYVRDKIKFIGTDMPVRDSFITTLERKLQDITIRQAKKVYPSDSIRKLADIKRKSKEDGQTVEKKIEEITNQLALLQTTVDGLSGKSSMGSHKEKSEALMSLDHSDLSERPGDSVLEGNIKDEPISASKSDRKIRKRRVKSPKSKTLVKKRKDIHQRKNMKQKEVESKDIQKEQDRIGKLQKSGMVTSSERVGIADQTVIESVVK